MLFSNYESNHTALIKRQTYINIDVDTYKSIIFVPTEPTVSVQHLGGVLDEWNSRCMDLIIIIGEVTEYEYERWTAS